MDETAVAAARARNTDRRQSELLIWVAIMFVLQLASIVGAGLVMPLFDPVPIIPIVLALRRQRREAPGGRWLVAAAFAGTVGLLMQILAASAFFGPMDARDSVWGPALVAYLVTLVLMWLLVLIAAGYSTYVRFRRRRA